MLKVQSLATTPPKKSNRFSAIAALASTGQKKRDYSLDKILDENSFSSFDDFMVYVNGLNVDEVQRLLISILKKDPSCRFPFEILFLKHSLQHLAFFKEVQQKISDENFNELFKELRVEYHAKSSVLFNYGDTGKKLYVILQGSIYVLVPRLKVTKKEEIIVKRLNESMRNNFVMEEPEEEKKNKDSLRKEESLPKKEEFPKKEEISREPEQLLRRESNQRKEEISLKQEEFSFPLAEEGLLAIYPNFRIANMLGEGALFGEISLSLKEPRAATVICRENAYFCVLKANVYEKVREK
jgi:CRP-like cAMP-binding protein